jgi:hypothetical protein
MIMASRREQLWNRRAVNGVVWCVSGESSDFDNAEERDRGPEQAGVSEANGVTSPRLQKVPPSLVGNCIQQRKIPGQCRTTRTDSIDLLSSRIELNNDQTNPHSMGSERLRVPHALS